MLCYLCSSGYFFLLFFFLCYGSRAAGLDFKNLLTNSTSSESFIIFSGTASEQRVLLRHLEALRESFFSKTSLREQKNNPMVVVIHCDAVMKDRARWEIKIVEGGLLKMQIDLRNDAFNSIELDQQVVDLLLLQSIYEQHSESLQVGASIPILPPWLVIGLTQWIRKEKDISISFSLMEDFVNALSLTEFLHQQPPVFSSVLLERYSEEARALMQVGLADEKGQSSFCKALFLLFNQETKKEDILNFWPEGWDKKKSEFEWRAMLAQRKHSPLGVNSSFYFDAVTSLKQIKSSIATMFLLKQQKVNTKMRLNDHIISSQCVVHSFQDSSRAGVASRNSLTEQQLMVQLQALQQQCNPLVLPLVQHSTALLPRLNKMPEQKKLQALVALQEEEKLVTRQYQAIGDYLNWYEATKASVPSGQFDGMLQPTKQETSFQGSIGRHLDDLEAKGW
ncbi:MAG: hypothetical protein A3F67_05470 [Verrucomicrobia bacterium RIFCSPHIGHO2_12_FULL_41_10]|nr:MAG: hypothetical protein A3F67_05470 [Verrucomicrobia bacterium RIFCSPHIGHO2_12_FULL_41_10]HLB32602.1 hypothetical protein [Chthoniobacterales bacterium]